MADDDELDLETGEETKAKTSTKGGGGAASPATEQQRKQRGRPTNDAKTSDLKKTIEEGLEELSQWMGRDSELGNTLRDGAPRMAKVLAARASRHQRVERGLRIAFAADGPLAILRAFGPFARAIGDKVGALRDRGDVQYVDEEGFLVDPDTKLRILDANGQPIRGDA